jgi:glucose/arabinose dehydrogenase
VRRRTIAGLLTVVVALAGCTGEEGPSPGATPTGDLPDDGTLRPLAVADLGDTVTVLTPDPDRGRLLVGRRSGTIYALELETSGEETVPRLDPAPVLDLSDTVTTDGERGLFDAVVGPDGTSLFVSFTDAEGFVTVTRHRVDDEGVPVDPVTVARVEHPFAGHNGGDLEWHGDDLLWSLGDMDVTTTTPPLAQDPGSPLGGIVRLTSTDEGLAATDLVPRLLAKGLRNPWRIHVDEETGSLLIADVGGDRFEEVDVLDLGTGGDRPVDFGWPHREGNGPGPVPSRAVDRSVPPVFEREHADDVCAIAGGVIVPAALSPSLAGRFLVSDNCSGAILAVDPATGEADEVADVGDGVAVIAAGADDDVYALGIGGTVWRLDPAAWEVEEPVQPTVDPPPRDDGVATDSLTPEEFAAVCDTRAAFDLLSGVPGADPAAYRRLTTEADRLLEASLDELPPEADAGPLRQILDDAAAVGRATGWDTSSASFEALFADVTAGRPPYAGFPEAIATIVDLGAAC